MGVLEKPITTQEELDAIIGERLARKDEQVKKQYGDYEDLKKKVAEYETSIADYTKQLEAASKKAASHDKEVAELSEKVKSYETASVKTKIAHEHKIPYELAGRLSGETEEEIRADAANLAKLLSGGGTPAPLADPEGSKAAGDNAGYKSLLSSLTSKGE